jgi:excinuclease ABC subunit B
MDHYQEDLLQAAENLPVFTTIRDLEKEIKKLEKEMQAAARELAFEQAAALRDRIKALRKLEIEIA